MEPMAIKGIIINRGVQMGRRDAPARRTARLSRLKALAARYAAAYIVNYFAHGRTHGHFNQSGVYYLAAQRKDLCALALFRTHGGEPFGAVKDNLGDVGIGFNVIEQGGLSENTFNGGERRTGTGLAALALYAGKQCSFFAADKRACAQTYLNVKAKIGAKDIFAQQPVFAGLVYSYLKSFNRYGIFGADIYSPDPSLSHNRLWSWLPARREGRPQYRSGP